MKFQNADIVLKITYNTPPPNYLTPQTNNHGQIKSNNSSNRKCYLSSRKWLGNVRIRQKNKPIIMENNLENKARFFAQYWWQKLFVLNGNNEDTYNNWRTEDLDKGYMLLTPLSDITDEDAVGLAKLEGDTSVEDFINRGKVLVKIIFGGYDFPSSFYNLEKITLAVDYLRSKGYALPYMGLSVEEQIEYGWVKLKTLNK